MEFKRQVVQAYLTGETLNNLSERYDVSRNLIRIWIQKFEAGAFDEDTVAVDVIQEYQVPLTALEQLVGKQAF